MSRVISRPKLCVPSPQNIMMTKESSNKNKIKKVLIVDGEFNLVLIIESQKYFSDVCNIISLPHLFLYTLYCTHRLITILFSF